MVDRRITPSANAPYGYGHCEPWQTMLPWRRGMTDGHVAELGYGLVH